MSVCVWTMELATAVCVRYGLTRKQLDKHGVKVKMKNVGGKRVAHVNASEAARLALKLKKCVKVSGGNGKSGVTKNDEKMKELERYLLELAATLSLLQFEKPPTVSTVRKADAKKLFQLRESHLVTMKNVGIEGAVQYAAEEVVAQAENAHRWGVFGIVSAQKGALLIYASVLDERVKLLSRQIKSIARVEEVQTRVRRRLLQDVAVAKEGVMRAEKLLAKNTGTMEAFSNYLASENDSPEKKTRKASSQKTPSTKRKRAPAPSSKKTVSQKKLKRGKKNKESQAKPIKHPLYEVAACSASHNGPWEGVWEPAVLLSRKKTRGVCDVKIASDGMVCTNVPERFVRLIAT